MSSSSQNTCWNGCLISGSRSEALTSCVKGCFGQPFPLIETRLGGCSWMLWKCVESKYESKWTIISIVFRVSHVFAKHRDYHSQETAKQHTSTIPFTGGKPWSSRYSKFATRKYCWWKKSQTTTWDDAKTLEIMGINYQPQLVSRIVSINSITSESLSSWRTFLASLLDKRIYRRCLCKDQKTRRRLISKHPLNFAIP